MVPLDLLDRRMGRDEYHTGMRHSISETGILLTIVITPVHHFRHRSSRGCQVSRTRMGASRAYQVQHHRDCRIKYHRFRTQLD